VVTVKQLSGENCLGYFCNDCNLKEHSGRITRNHQRLSLKEKSKKPTFSKCLIHHQDKKYWCKDENELLCDVCVIDDHKSHQVLSVFKLTNGFRDELKKCAAPLQDRQVLENKERDFRQKKAKNEEKLKSVEEQARVLKEKIIQTDANIKEIQERQEKVKISEVVLFKLIEEMGVNELMDFLVYFLLPTFGAKD